MKKIDFDVNIKDQMIGGYAYVKIHPKSIPSSGFTSKMHKNFKPEIPKFDTPKHLVLPSFSLSDEESFLENLTWSNSWPGFSSVGLTSYVINWIKEKECTFFIDKCTNSICLEEFHGLIIHNGDVLQVFYQHCD